jgi:hypothetical protein
VQRTLLLHFLKFDIHSTELDPGEWIDELYGASNVRSVFPHRQATLTLEIEPLDRIRAAREPWPDGAVFAETNLCGAPCYYADGRFYAARDGELPLRLEYDFASSTIRALVGGLFLTSGQYIVIDLIRPILQSFLLPFYGLKSLHGAVVHGHGRTIFLDGPGGAGKTTTALMLARAGYDLLSDDGPLFVADGGRTFVLSSMDFAHLTEGTVRLFPELEPLVVGGKDSRGKFSVSLRPWQRSGSLAPLAVTHYIRLRRGTCPAPRLFPLERADVLHDFVDSSLVVFRPAPFRGDRRFLAHSQETLHLVRGFVRDAEPWGLEFADRHLPDIPALLAAVLS